MVPCTYGFNCCAGESAVVGLRRRHKPTIPRWGATDSCRGGYDSNN